MGGRVVSSFFHPGGRESIMTGRRALFKILKNRSSKMDSGG